MNQVYEQPRQSRLIWRGWSEFWGEITQKGMEFYTRNFGLKLSFVNLVFRVG